MLLTQTLSGDIRAIKRLPEDTALTEVRVRDARAIWIEGANHTFTLLDQQGNPVEETTRLGANVLLWTSGGIDFRLELSGDLEEALTIANSLEER